ncbi:MAG TPA: hypothetical protein VGV17_10355 [Bosea sp. (in: a-proteobacteria)]|jgi:hypothetical protein|uniref:hypothetical protein n=1 Tax=Bosea sp. (in: a-proteobacteria) TaxID=1871050 RepID=UPI002DDD0C61|nr:hypothetical protein [Bosea sp. (in: a-proteobacteria)]HEV2554150.1 hypothetical protein [Bosea sp. (in: a-proteobacteria)]
MIGDDGFDARWLGKSIPEHHWHFHRRLLERYEIVLAPGEFSEMLKDIASGKAPLVQRRSAKSAVYLVRNRRLFERYFVLVTDGEVRTTLPPSKSLKRARRSLPG